MYEIIGNLVLTTGIVAGIILVATINANYQPNRKLVRVKPKKYGESIRKKRMLKRNDNLF